MSQVVRIFHNRTVRVGINHRSNERESVRSRNGSNLSERIERVRKKYKWNLFDKERTVTAPFNTQPNGRRFTVSIAGTMLGYLKQCWYDSITIPQFISHCLLQDPCRERRDVWNCQLRLQIYKGPVGRSVGRSESSQAIRSCRSSGSFVRVCVNRVVVPAPCYRLEGAGWFPWSHCRQPAKPRLLSFVFRATLSDGVLYFTSDSIWCGQIGQREHSARKCYSDFFRSSVITTGRIFTRFHPRSITRRNLPRTWHFSQRTVLAGTENVS